MAYATGSAATVDDMLEAIENFAIADGWTIQKRATNLLFLEKGICKVVMGRHVYTYTDYATGSAVSTTDHSIGASLCTSINTALNQYWSHPGSLVTSETDGDGVHCNALFNGIAEYHLFSGDTGAGDPDYIYCVMRTTGDLWRHFGFGLADKRGMSHSGAAFLSGSSGRFYRDGSSLTSGGTYFNQAGRAPYPYLRNRNAVETRGGGFNHYIPDALPNTPDWSAMSSDRQVWGINGRDKASTQFPFSSTICSPGISQPICGAPPSQWGGQAQLFPCHIFYDAPVPDKLCYVGDYPNVRALNMEGLLPKQELTLAGDTWFVAPISRQTAWMTQAEAGAQHTSGHYALAFKKIV